MKLGEIYKDGKGVLQHTIAAHMRWNIAAVNGHTGAVESRDITAKKLS